MKSIHIPDVATEWHQRHQFRHIFSLPPKTNIRAKLLWQSKWNCSWKAPRRRTTEDSASWCSQSIAATKPRAQMLRSQPALRSLAASATSKLGRTCSSQTNLLFVPQHAVAAIQPRPAIRLDVVRQRSAGRSGPWPSSGSRAVYPRTAGWRP